MTPREVIEGYLGECFGPETRMDQIGLYAAEIQQALAAAGYAVVKTDPIQDQVIRALAAVGWAVVPVEPTEAMYDAGAEARKAIKSGGAIGQTIENMLKYERRFEHAIYKSMIASAQKDPA